MKFLFINIYLLLNSELFMLNQLVYLLSYVLLGLFKITFVLMYNLHFNIEVILWHN